MSTASLPLAYEHDFSREAAAAAALAAARRACGRGRTPRSKRGRRTPKRTPSERRACAKAAEAAEAANASRASVPAGGVAPARRDAAARACPVKR